MKTILENEFATVKVYPEKKIIHHQFHKFVFGDAFKEVMLKAANAFQANRCTKWLSDDRGNSSLLKADTDWAYAVWEPKVLASGWKYWAMILPQKLIGQMNIKQISARYVEKGINFKVFSEPSEALAWLEKQP
jgi:hypothetical protein